MRIILLGAPGCGKGAQARLLSAHYRLPRISMREMLQRAVAEKKLKLALRKLVKAGRPLDVEVLNELLDARLRARDCKRGFFMDDYPDNIPQAQAFDILLGLHGGGVQMAVYLELDEDSWVKRVTGRQMCTARKCNAVYNFHHFPPKKRHVCDKCGGRVGGVRQIKRPNALLWIESHREKLQPLLDYYRAQHKLRSVHAVGSLEEIRARVCETIDLEIRPLAVKPLEAGEPFADASGTIIAGGQINRIPELDEFDEFAADLDEDG